MRNILAFRNWISFLFLVSIHGCNSSGPSKSPEPTPRQGVDLSIPAGPTDTNPSLSSNGTKMVFISTRDKVRRIYKTSSDIGSSQVQASVLMSDGIVQDGVRLAETQAWLSPDGSKVFFTVEGAFSPTKTSLYSVDFQTGSNATKILDTDGTVLSLVFSSDSKFFAFTKSVNGTSTVSIAELASPTALHETGSDEQVAFFLSTTYELITYTQSDSVSFHKVSFPDANFVLTRQDWGENPTQKTRIKGALSFSLSKDNAYFVEDVSSKRTALKVNGNSSKLENSVPPEYKDLQNDSVLSKAIASTVWKEEGWKVWGPDIVSLSFNQSAELGVYVSKERHLCNDDKVPVGGRTLSFVKPLESSFTWLLPLMDTASKELSLGGESDLCSPPSGKEIGIVQSAIMQSGQGLVDGDYRIVYTSNQARLFFIDIKKDGTKTIVQVQ